MERISLQRLGSQSLSIYAAIPSLSGHCHLMARTREACRLFFDHKEQNQLSVPRWQQQPAEIQSSSTERLESCKVVRGCAHGSCRRWRHCLRRVFQVVPVAKASVARLTPWMLSIKAKAVVPRGSDSEACTFKQL